MPRLPQPGADAGSWGEILNGYLLQSHDTDGSLKADAVGAPQLKPGAVTNASVSNTAAITQDKIAGLTTDLTAKADDSAVVHKTGDETVADIKTFSSAPVVPDASFTIAKTNGLQTALDATIPLIQKAAASGVASLDSSTKVPITQIPVQAIADDPVLTSTIVTVGSTAFTPLGAGERPQVARFVPDVLTSFQSGHGWTAVSGGGTTTLNDTSDFYAGSQCVRLVTNGAGASQIVGSPVVTAIPADHFYRLWIKFDTAETIARIRIFASDGSGFTNYYSIEAVISSAGTAEVKRKWKAGEWVPVDLPLESATIVGTPNAAALTYLRVLVNDRNVVGTVRLGRLDYVEFPSSQYPAGVVSFTYDDSWLTAYTVARPLLAQYGYAGTLFPILERIDTAGYLTTAQVRSLVRDYGWEIGGHATTYAAHVTSVAGMTQAERRAEFGAIRSWMAGNGFNGPTFAYPNGDFTTAALSDLQDYFTLGRMAVGRSSVGVPDELQHPGSLPLRILAINGGSTAAATVRDEVDRAVANGTWLVIVFHNIVTPKVDSNDIIPTDHAAIINHIAGSGVAVRTMQEVLRAHVA